MSGPADGFRLVNRPRRYRCDSVGTLWGSASRLSPMCGFCNKLSVHFCNAGIDTILYFRGHGTFFRFRALLGHGYGVWEGKDRAFDGGELRVAGRQRLSSFGRGQIQGQGQGKAVQRTHGSV